MGTLLAKICVSQAKKQRDPQNIAIGARIAQFRERIGLKQEDFAKRLKVSPRTLSGVENGYGNITKVVAKLANFSKFPRTEWVLYGRGEMFDDDAPRAGEVAESDAERKVWQVSLRGTEARLVLYFQELDQDQQQRILRTVEEMRRPRGPTRTLRSSPPPPAPSDEEDQVPD